MGRIVVHFLSVLKCPVCFNHSVILGLGFFICFDIEVRWRRTKHAFFTFYTLIKHGFSTNQSTCKGPIYIINKNTMHVPINVKHIALGVGGGNLSDAFVDGQNRLTL